MYKVLKNLPGYGYCIGDETIHIKEEDSKSFLEMKMIELLPEKKKESTKGSK